MTMFINVRHAYKRPQDDEGDEEDEEDEAEGEVEEVPAAQGKDSHPLWRISISC